MNKYQVLIKNNKDTGSLNYRQILAKFVKLVPKKDTDGLSIFIICDSETNNRLKRKHEWILDILLCTPSINIPKKERKKRVIRHSIHATHPRY